MKNRWIIIRSICQDHWAGEAFVKKMQKKFPKIQFKVGKIRVDPCIYLSEVTLLIPIMAFLPTPHPNEISRQVVEYARTLRHKFSWSSVRDKLTMTTITAEEMVARQQKKLSE